MFLLFFFTLVKAAHAFTSLCHLHVVRVCDRTRALLAFSHHGREEVRSDA